MDRPTMTEVPSRVRLMSVRRTVAQDATDAYLAAWARLRDAVVALGGKAWLFHASGRPEAHLEFLESRRLAEIVRDNDVSAAIRALDESFGPGAVELWEDAPLP